MTAAEAGGAPTIDESNEITEVIYGTDNIIKRSIEGLSIIKKTEDEVIASNGLSAFLPIIILKNQYHILKKRGVKIRFITEITKEDISSCKEAMEFAELRHLDGIKGNFGVHDGIVYTGAAILGKTGSPPQRLIYSNLKEIVVQHQYLFETLWNKSMPAEQKIKEIEQGIKPEFIEVIQDATKLKNLYFNLIKSATYEVMLIVPTINALRLHNNIGILKLLKEMTSPKNGSNNKEITIRILASLKNESNNIIDQKLLNDIISPSSIQLRNIETAPVAFSTIIVVDKKESLIIEVKNDLKDHFVDSIGFATYSNSKSTVLSFASIFESLWIQTELYQQLKEANEQLKIRDIMQKEFINIAAHELRNPIQPIIGLTDILKNKATDTEQQQLHDIVAKNAKKLKQLSEDILDITKIESQTLQMHKETFNLNELIQSTISDLTSGIKKGKLQQHKDTINIELVCNEDIIVYADKSRINQVVSNLLNNAIKFTNEVEEKEICGKDSRKITISLDKNGSNFAVVKIKDTGKGIDNEIVPRLFEKFATKSTSGGTGLGLFISKNIVEAHGGKIWAKNNDNGKGATFSFSLPLVNQILKES